MVDGSGELTTEHVKDTGTGLEDLEIWFVGCTENSGPSAKYMYNYE